jgi:4-diphosphocytidyl-2-C-methyl-D-erythritol kinase
MLTLSSPAKINLFLRILHRRPDGYHEVATAMQTIGLSDKLTLNLADSDHLSCTDPTIPTDDTNLVMKAVHLFRRRTGAAFGVHAHLEKRIPAQAGLGGGSSNAATTLWGLNALLGKPATENQLMSWAAEIGSDIPFFFSQGSAYCTGRGEKILPLTPFPQMAVTIIKPAQGLSTPEVYRRLNAAELPQRNPEEHLHDLIAGKKCFFNDLETPAFEALPSLGNLREELLGCGYNKVIMSGSGSAFFCIGEAKSKVNSNLFHFPTQYVTRQPGAWFKEQLSEK